MVLLTMHLNRDVDEEEMLLHLVAKYGQAWKKIALELKTRTGTREMLFH